MEPVWTVVEDLHKTAAMCCWRAAHAQVRLCVSGRVVLEKAHWVNNAWKDIWRCDIKNSPLRQTRPGWQRWALRSNWLISVAMEKIKKKKKKRVGVAWWVRCRSRRTITEQCKENKLCQSASEKALRIISCQNTAVNTKWLIISQNENIVRMLVDLVTRCIMCQRNSS